VQVTRSIVVDRPIEDVFDFLGDARNDPRWCPKVLSSEQVDGDGAGPGARYAVLHRPIPLLPARAMTMSCESWQPPRVIEWLEEDGSDSLEVTYTLQEVGASTRVTQRSVATLSTPRLLAPIMRYGLGRDIARQLRSLQRLLR